MLNSHQILPGARTRGTIKTYVDADYITDVEFTAAGSELTINGQIELDGVPFELGKDKDGNDKTLNLTSVLPMLGDGEYIVGAVPGYIEPLDRAAATSEGVNYYVSDTALGETTVHYFLPAELENEVLQAGGHLVLAKRRNLGTATSGELMLLNRYEDELEKLSDPRYVGQLLEPVEVKYVLRKVYQQDNRSRRDALSEMTNQDLELFKATQGYIAARREVLSTGEAATKYEANEKQAKVKRAFAYASEEDAKNDVNGVEIMIDDYKSRPDIFSNAQTFDGSNATGSHVAVFELYQPTYMSRGHYGTQPGTEKLYTRDEAKDVLGRVNPIYLANDMTVARASFNRARPLGALTRYAHALVVGRFKVSNNAIDGTPAVYTPGTIKPAGAPAGGTTPGFNSGVGHGNVAP